MFKSLLYLGICAVSFAFFQNTETYEIKMAAAVFFAIALSTAEIFYNGIKPNKNVWLLIFLAYLPISILLAPCPQINLFGIDTRNFYSWFPFLKILVFSVMFLVISGHEFDQRELITIFKIFVWCGFVTAIYEIFQFLYTDQFFTRCADGDWGRIGGFIGNPTLTSPYCAVMVPFALYLKKYFKAFIMVIGVIIPYSVMGVFGLVAGVLFYYGLKSKRIFIACATGLVIFFLVVTVLFFTNKTFNAKFNDHERLYQWERIFKDWNGPLDHAKKIEQNYSLTGRGLGSFRYIYRLQHPFGATNDQRTANTFAQAHNDYIELGYHLGHAGLFLVLATIFFVLKSHFSLSMNGYRRALFGGIVGMLVTATGTFLFQIGTFSFLAVLLGGLLQNKNELRCNYGLDTN